MKIKTNEDDIRDFFNIAKEALFLFACFINEEYILGLIIIAYGIITAVDYYIKRMYVVSISRSTIREIHTIVCDDKKVNEIIEVLKK